MLLVYCTVVLLLLQESLTPTLTMTHENAQADKLRAVYRQRYCDTLAIIADFYGIKYCYPNDSGKFANRGAP